MKSVLLFLGSLLLIANTSAAEITPEKNIRLMVINGQETSDTTEPVALEEGFNQIVVKVFKTFGRGSDKQSFESDPFLLMFYAADEDISIFPPELKNYDDTIKHFKHKPDMKLISNETELQFEYAKLEGKKGFFPYSDLEGLVAEYNQKNKISDTNLKNSSPEVGAKHFVPTFEQLKQWYPDMSKEEREAFRRWVLQQ